MRGNLFRFINARYNRKTLRSVVGLVILIGQSPMAMADHGGSTAHEPMGLSVPSTSSTGDYSVTWTVGTRQLQERKVGGYSYTTIYEGTSPKSFTNKGDGTYYYRLRKQFCKWSECIWYYSEPEIIVVSNVTPPGKPGPISGPSTVYYPSGRANYTLTWTKASGSVGEYQLRWRKDGGNWGTIHVSSNEQPLSPTDGTYDYRVAACNDAGCSAFTAIKTIEVIYMPLPGVPGAISGESSIPSADNSATFTLTWGQASGTVDEYVLERRIGIHEGWQEILPTAPRSRTEVNFPYGTYRYQVKACNSSGCSAFTDMKTVQVVYLALPGAPGAISGPPSVIDATGEGVDYTLSWTAASGTVDTYRVERRSGTSNWGSPIQESNSQTLDQTMTAGTYEYRVAACNGSGCGPYTGIKSVSVTYQPPAPGVPGTISAPPILYDSTGTEKSYWLNWGGASGTVTRYELERRSNGEPWSLPLDLEPDDATSFQETGMTDGIYEYHVRACNGPSCSDYTDIASVEVASALADGEDFPRSVGAVGTTPYDIDVSATGDATINIPLELIDGMAGFGPSLSLAYDSGRGIDRLERSLPEDTIGYGWHLAGLSHIRRCVVNQSSAASVQLNNGDSLCLNGMPLVLASGSHFAVGAVYRTLIESYIRIEIKGTAGALWFEATLPDGTVQEYGGTDGSRVDLNGGTDYQWSLNKATGADGNVITYTWYRDIGKGINYIAGIDYAGAEVEFEYSPRTDAVPMPIAGGSQEQSVALHTVRVRMNDQKIREYLLFKEDVDGRHRLDKVQQCGYDGLGLVVYCLAPLDFSWLTPSSTVPGVPLLVAGMTDGLGAHHVFEYGTIIDGTESFLFSEEPFGDGVLPPDTQLLTGSGARRFVATKLRRDNGLGGYHDISYAYQDVGVESTRHWGFLGFFAQRITDEASGIVTYAQYRLDYPHFGRLARILQVDAVYGSHSQTLSRAEWDYARQAIVHTGGSSVYPYVSSEISFIYEGSTQLGATQAENVLTFSSGIVSQMVSTTTTATGVSTGSPQSIWGDLPDYSLSGSILSTTTKTVVFTNRTTAGQWLINFPESIRTESWRGAPGGEAIVQYTTLDPRANSLEPSVITRFPNDLELTLVTNYVYDANGRLRDTTISGDDVNTRTTSADFYSGERYPWQITNAEGHTTSFGEYDERFGTVSERGDPNGKMATWERDPFGRLRKHTNGDGVETTTTYGSCAGSCPTINGVAPAFSVTRDSAITPVEKAYFDKLGRVLRTERQSLDGSFSNRDFAYDSQGRVKKVSLPYFSGTPNYIVYGYDLRNRVTSVLRPDGSTTSTVFSASADRVIATITEVIKKADGSTDSTQVKRNEFNILRQLVKTTDAYGSSGATSTTYAYDANGNLEMAIVDGGAAGTTTSIFEHDAAGNRKKIIDPDLGTVILTYTALGQLHTRLDNMGQFTSFGYDLLGRLKTRTDPEGQNIWTWDTAVNGVGKLKSRSGPDGFLETYGYNDDGKLETVTTQFIPIGGTNPTSYTTSHTYDTDGRPRTTTYPGGFELTRVYNTNGYLSELRDGTTAIQTFNNLDAFGHSTHETYGNGVETWRDYDPKTGRLTDIDTSSGSTILQNNEYGWRSNGTLESRTAHPTAGLGSARQEIYTYDVLNRLKVAETYINGSNTRDLNYAYDALGNIDSKTSTLSGDTDVTNYDYGYAGGKPGPHGVWSAVIDGVVNTLTYDDNGAVTRYDIAGTSEDKWLEYNVANQPTKIVIGNGLADPTPQVREVFRYDPNGRRYARETTWQENGNTRTEEVHYVGDVEIISYPLPDEITHVYKTRLGPNVMHVETEGSRLIDGQPRYWSQTHFEYAHRDHLGSIEVVTDGSGARLHNLAFEPFGARKQADWSGNLTTAELDALLVRDWDRTPKVRGFTGHEHLDRTGFIHMNGRIYDPVLGRFLSPDPFVQFPMFSQSWNRYSYVDNKPTSFTDPSGFMEQTDASIETITVVGTSTGYTYWLSGLLPYDRFQGSASGGRSAYGESRRDASGAGETDVDERASSRDLMREQWKEFLENEDSITAEWNKFNYPAPFRISPKKFLRNLLSKVLMEAYEYHDWQIDKIIYEKGLDSFEAYRTFPPSGHRRRKFGEWRAVIWKNYDFGGTVKQTVDFYYWRNDMGDMRPADCYLSGSC